MPVMVGIVDVPLYTVFEHVTSAQRSRFDSFFAENIQNPIRTLIESIKLHLKSRKGSQLSFSKLGLEEKYSKIIQPERAWLFSASGSHLERTIPEFPDNPFLGKQLPQKIFNIHGKGTGKQHFFSFRASLLPQGKE